MITGSAPGTGRGDHPGPGPPAVLAGGFLTGQQDRGGAVGQARGVARVMDMLDRAHLRIDLAAHVVEGPVVAVQDHAAQLGERRRQPSQFVQAGSPGQLLLVRNRAAVLTQHRDDRPGEPAVGDGLGRPVLRLQRVGVNLGPAEAVQAGDQVGGDALRDHRVARPQLFVAAVQGEAATGGIPRHHLHARGHHHIGLAGGDHHRRGVDRLLTRSAEPVHGQAGHVVRPARGQYRQPGDAVAVVTDRVGAPGQHVLDLGRVEPGAAGQLAEHSSQQLLRLHPDNAPPGLPLPRGVRTTSTITAFRMRRRYQTNHMVGYNVWCRTYEEVRWPRNYVSMTGWRS